MQLLCSTHAPLLYSCSRINDLACLIVVDLNLVVEDVEYIGQKDIACCGSCSCSCSCCCMYVWPVHQQQQYQQQQHNIWYIDILNLCSSIPIVKILLKNTIILKHDLIDILNLYSSIPLFVQLKYYIPLFLYSSIPLLHDTSHFIPAWGTNDSSTWISWGTVKKFQQDWW